MGLDAPELHGRCPAEIAQARAARHRLAVLVKDGVTLHPHGRDRYRRLLAVVRDSRGRDVALVMIREGHARPYDGRGRRQGWCSVG
jgi:endonuclease YncB( thermonuclease family)